MLRQVAENLIVIAAVVTAIGVIARVKPVRWLFRTTVGTPLHSWFRREVGEVVDERLDARPLTNGWGARAVQSIAEATGADVEPPPPDSPE